MGLTRLSAIGLVGIAFLLFALPVGRQVQVSVAADARQQTQIVVQWLDDSPPRSSPSAYSLLGVLEARSQNLYLADGYDVGSGTVNLFLYSADPEMAVRRVIQIFEEGYLPPGMRIGVAEYKNADRTDWTYRPAYPADLNNFDITYCP